MNLTLQKLGFDAGDTVVVFHADDIGMCHASVDAYSDLLSNSPLTSAAVMVPCPWFPATAQLIRERGTAANVDMGVHLTITSEWDTMRWGPISTGDPATGLLDTEGYFYRDIASSQRFPYLKAVEMELRAQIERALSAEIDITHIDTHMGTMFCLRYAPIYLKLALEYKIPALVSHREVAQLKEWGNSAEDIAQLAATIEDSQLPQFDSIDYLPLRPLDDDARFALAVKKLNLLNPGLHYFIIHPSTNTPELRAVAPDWAARVGDYTLFMSDRWHHAVEASGIKTLGMNALRSAMQS